MKRHIVEVKVIQTYQIEVDAEDMETALEKVGNMYDTYIYGNADLVQEDREENYISLAETQS